MSTSVPAMSSGELMVRSHMVLGLTQKKFAELIGVSLRTVQRWSSTAPGFSRDMLAILARALYPVDPNLARVAAANGRHTLESLGLVTPPAPAPPATPAEPPRLRMPAPVVQLVAEAILYAAAESLELPRDTARRALLGALDRAVLAGLTIEELVGALQAVPLVKAGGS